MKNVLSHKLIEYANKVAKVPGMKALLKPLYYPYKNLITQKRNKAFRKNALKVLKEFNEVMERENLFYTLAFGTMLGAIREKGFIKHDLDIDVFMWKDDHHNVPQVLSNAGFHLCHVFLAENGDLGREETYEKDDVTVDVFYVYPPFLLFPYTCDFGPLPGAVTNEQSMREMGGVLARRIEIPVSTTRVKVSFEGIELYVPENYDQFLSFRYGQDYMIPNPSWHNGDNPHIIDWDTISSTYESFE